MTAPTSEDKLREIHKILGESITELLVDWHVDEAIDAARKMQMVEKMIREGNND